MKYVHAAVLATALIASGWAVNAHASQGDSNPSDVRTLRVVAPMPTVTIKPADGGSNAQDPFGMRTPGVTFSTSAVTIKPADGGSNAQDPFGMRTPGVTRLASAVTIKPADGGSNAQDPFGMTMRGVAFADPSTQLASQPVHRAQSLADAHAPTATNANPNG